MAVILLALGTLAATAPRRPFAGQPVRSSASPVEAIPVTAAQAKADLLAAVEGTDRGFAATDGERDRVKSLLATLAAIGDRSPEPASCFYDMPDPDGFAPQGENIGGRWELVYTDAPDIISLGKIPWVKLVRVGQECDPVMRTIANVIEYAPPDAVVSLPYSQLPFELPFDPNLERIEQRVVLKALCTRAQPRRVQLSVEGLDIVPKQVLGYSGAPVEFRGPLSGQVPFGSFEVLYLDEDLRVTRTDQGYVAVNIRDEGEPANVPARDSIPAEDRAAGRRLDSPPRDAGDDDDAWQEI